MVVGISQFLHKVLAMYKHVLKQWFQKNKKPSRNLAKVRIGPSRTSFNHVWKHFLTIF